MNAPYYGDNLQVLRDSIVTKSVDPNAERTTVGMETSDDPDIFAVGVLMIKDGETKKFDCRLSIDGFGVQKKQTWGPFNEAQLCMHFAFSGASCFLSKHFFHFFPICLFSSRSCYDEDGC